MRNKIRSGLLLDYYGAFLTDKQRDMLSLSVNEDLSLSEIAERRGVSKQAVRDALLRGEKQMCEMEEKLGLAERDRRALLIIDRVAEEVASCGADNEKIGKINGLLDVLTGILEGSDGV